MATESIRNKDSGVLSWGGNFSPRISASPEVFGFTTGEATELANLYTDYANALATATNPGTRTKGSIAAKSSAKGKFLALARTMAARVQANPGVTAEQKVDLGLHIRKTSHTPVPPPVTAPITNVMAIGNARHTVRIADEATPNKRAKPFGATGAEVYTYLVETPGTLPPPSLGAWKFEGLVTRSPFEVTYSPDDAGKTAYIVARWVNGKGEAGPTSVPVSAQVLGMSSGVTLPLAA